MYVTSKMTNEKSTAHCANVLYFLSEALVRYYWVNIYLTFLKLQENIQGNIQLQLVG